MISLASEYIRTHWRDTLDRVFKGETITVVRYGKIVAVMVQPEQWQRISDELVRLREEHDQSA